jgi:ABC-2 type transport system permease protein
MWSICKKDFNQFFSSLSGYIAMICFLLINGIYLFVLPAYNILDSGYATLDAFFTIAPWVMVILIPAITMRSFTDEYRFGTFETLRTRPISPTKIVLGKYLAVLMIVALVLIPTFLYVITIRSLSINHQLDTGGLVGSYIGLMLLSAAYGAIGLFCSGFTTNPILSFLSAAFLCIIMYFGFSAISSIPTFKGGVDYYINLMGMDFHYRSISRGVLDTRDFVYFILVGFFFLFITSKKIQQRAS